MKVRDAMQRHVTTVYENDPLGLARQLMVLSNVRALPVLRAGDDRVVGVIAERDLLRALATSVDHAAMYARSVRDYMATPVESVRPEAELSDAAAIILERPMGALPVLEAGALVGMLTEGDVLREWSQARHAGARSTERPGETPVREIMFSDPITAHEHDGVIETAARMGKRTVRHACVVDDDGCVVGVISDRDVRRVLGDVRLALAPGHVPEHLRRLTVGQIMTLKPRCVVEDAPVSQALAMLVTHQHVGALPVVDARGRLRGLVSYIDVLKKLAADLERRAD